jgi:[ribosomal protein S18]-alanine N-acetyltransferase
VSPPLGQLDITPMSQDEAEKIASWRYEPPYDFYDARADETDLAELLDPALRIDRYFSAYHGDELVGSFVFTRVGDVVFVGLGLRPDLTGRGLGPSFVEGGLDFARQRFAPDSFRLSVAEFNERAVAVYERVGFTVTRRFVHETNGGVFPFVEMERPA